MTARRRHCARIKGTDAEILLSESNCDDNCKKSCWRASVSPVQTNPCRSHAGCASLTKPAVHYLSRTRAPQQQETQHQAAFRMGEFLSKVSITTPCSLWKGKHLKWVDSEGNRAHNCLVWNTLHHEYVSTSLALYFSSKSYNVKSTDVKLIVLCLEK